MDYPCPVVSLVIVVSVVLVLSCRLTHIQTQTHTHRHTDAAKRFTPMTVVDVSKYIHTLR